MELNSKLIKLSGKIEMSPEQNLENGQSVILTCQGEVVAVQENNNQDNTFDRIYKVKIATAEILSCVPRGKLLENKKNEQRKKNQK